MKIELKKVGKRYQENWIFKDISLTFKAGRQYALLGINGSGKSTLLRIIGGIQTLNVGSIVYSEENNIIQQELIYKELSFCAPGMDIVEEMTLRELLNFHFSFKKIISGYDVDRVIQDLKMENIQNKFIHDFSSGMKQRVKLALAFYSDTQLLFLDEPCSNLDLQGVELYEEWIRLFSENRTVIIASNDKREYQKADYLISLEDYKV